MKISEAENVEIVGIDEEGSLGRLNHRIMQIARRMNESARAVEEEKEFLKSFLSDISHQLKTPLSSLRMFQELLLDSDAAADEQTRDGFLSRALAQIDRMEWLIRTLLTIARLEAGAL